MYHSLLIFADKEFCFIEKIWQFFCSLGGRFGGKVIQWYNIFKTQKPYKLLPYKALFSGAKQDRTADLLNAIQALSQLSYSPNSTV